MGSEMCIRDSSRSAEVTPRTKPINVTFHHVWSREADSVVDVTYVKTELQRADILIKTRGGCEVSREPPTDTRSVFTSPLPNQTYV